MIEVLNNANGQLCTTLDYSSNPDKHRGNIECAFCGEKAWFIKGYDTENRSRMACFAAHHKEGCEAATVLLESDDNLDENGDPIASTSSDIYIDLDKSREQSLYISRENDKHGEEESTWKSAKSQKVLGNSSGFPLNKSLRQILTNLCRNPEYKYQDREIKIVAESGRVVLEGKLQDKVVHLTEITEHHMQGVWIFWGPINNIYLRKSGELWLNYGNSKEPSIILHKGLDKEVLKNFKIKEVEELDGSDVLVVAAAGFNNEQPIVRPAFTKYMTFRRHKLVEQE